MPGFLVDAGATINCPHGAPVKPVPSSPRVLLGGKPALVLSDTATVLGCPFTLPPATPSPCTTVRWLAPASRVRAGGQPVLVQSSSGVCCSPAQAPQGPPTIITTQMRVRGT